MIHPMITQIQVGPIVLHSGIASEPRSVFNKPMRRLPKKRGGGRGYAINLGPVSIETVFSTTAESNQLTASEPYRQRAS